jgi:hypothetical protein
MNIQAPAENAFEKKIIYTVEPLITDTVGEFKFCPL